MRNGKLTPSEAARFDCYTKLEALRKESDQAAFLSTACVMIANISAAAGLSFDALLEQLRTFHQTALDGLAYMPQAKAEVEELMAATTAEVERRKAEEGDDE